MGIPGSRPHIEGHNIFDLLWLCPQKSQLVEDVKRSIYQPRLDLDLVEHLEVEGDAALYKSLKNSCIRSFKTMVTGPHEDQSLSCCQPPGMTYLSTLNFLQLCREDSKPDTLNQLI